MPTTAPAEASPYSRHLPVLDGIRGFAAIGVIASHVFPGTSHNSFEVFVRGVFTFGANGVDLFFVLSGFLITGILYDSLAEPRYFRKFYARRALRIFPLYYGVLLALVILNFFHPCDSRQLLSTAIYLHNTYLIGPPIWVASGRFPLPLTHFWSLAVEEQFYLMWPLAVFFVRKRTPLLVLCLGAIVFCPLLRALYFHYGVDDRITHANVFSRADSLLAGAALALLLRGPRHDAALRYAPMLLLFGAVACCVFPWQGHQVFPALTPLGLSYTALAITACGLIGSALKTPAVSRPFQWRWLRIMGKYSYGFYVYHLILFSYLYEPLRHWLERHVSGNKAFAVLSTGLITAVLSFVVAYVSYEVYERHFLRLKRFFDYRPHPDAVLPAASS